MKSNTLLTILLALILNFILANGKTLSEKNFEGQKYLFKNGWHVIPSGSDAWKKFDHESLEPSTNAMSRAIKNIKDSPHRMKNFKAYLSSAKETDKEISKFSVNIEKEINKLSNELDKKGEELSNEMSSKMRDELVLGYVHLEKRTDTEVKRLKSFFRYYITDYDDLTKESEKDYSIIKKNFFSDTKTDWDKHFVVAKESFNVQYHKSGNRSNSITALWDIIVGHIKALYHGIVTPSAKSTKSLTKKSVVYITKGFYNLGMIGTSVVYSTGLSFYSAGSYGVKIISPSIKAGLFAAMSTLTYLGSKGAKYTLKGSGVIAKYSLKASGKAASASKFVGEGVYDGAKSVIYTTAQLGSAAGESILETSYGAIVLGYTALTQIPVQVLLASANSTIFLVWDGPKLIIAKVSGDELKLLPTGSVIDKKMIEQKGLKLEKLELDEKTKKEIFESIE